MRRRLLAWLTEPKRFDRIMFATIALGLSMLPKLLEEQHARLEELEADLAQVRGTVPLDDVVSLAELEKMGRQLRAEWELELAARGVPPRSQGTAAGA